LIQQTATSPTHRQAEYATNRSEPYVGNNNTAPARTRLANNVMTTQPCHALGKPHPKP